MKAGKSINNNIFRIINVKHIKHAKKHYNYYNGCINIGNSYFRGFGTRAGIPFEFFFTDTTIFESRKISRSILEQEYFHYWLERTNKESL